MSEGGARIVPAPVTEEEHEHERQVDTIYRLSGFQAVLDYITPPKEHRGSQRVFRCPVCNGLGTIGVTGHPGVRWQRTCSSCDGMRGLTGWEYLA